MADEWMDGGIVHEGNDCVRRVLVQYPGSPGQVVVVPTWVRRDVELYLETQGVPCDVRDHALQMIFNWDDPDL